MSADTIAIGVFLISLGLVLALAAFCLGITLFKDDQQYQAQIKSRRQLFWLEKLIAIQKPEYQAFSYVLHGLALLLMLSGSGWIIYHQL